MNVEVDIYAEAKRLRLEELDSRVGHFKQEYEFWQRQYCDHGDMFAMEMMNVSMHLWSSHKSLRDEISRWNTVCFPKHVYRFPTSPTS